MRADAKAERWQLLESLFQRASEMDSSDWDSFLNDACGEDVELRSQLEGMLAHADKTLGFLKMPVDEAALRLAFVGRRIGSYLLLRVLGEGGMGRVFLAARADEQYQQLVAIKLMHTVPWQSEAMLQRFRTERQILANLNHPNIGRLLDGGMTPEGVPYLVMEYVDGTPIDRYCRENGLSIRAKLQLFRSVCSAVEYAHKNLVVHKDIKPANVLVTKDGTPKLLDFGIAKLLDRDGEDMPQKSRPTERMMTPEYASPEQLRREPITTASDVYGLGVLLYDLLAGRHPFAEQIVNPVELARQVCEVDPLPPSAAALHNSVRPSSDVCKLKGDLDHIVLMAMRKEPERRYSSAAALAADISAYQNGYPLLAATNNWRYRAGKFVRRHKLGVVVAIVFVLSLSAFSVGMAVLTQRADQERLRVEQEQLRAELAARFLADMFRAATPGEARGRTVTARELLDRGASRIDKELAREPTVRASLLYSIADAYSALGLYDPAQQLAERAFKIRTQLLGPQNLSTADSLFLLANATRLKGEYEQAEPLFRLALDIRRMKAGDDSTVVADALSYLGECLFLEGKNGEAESKLRQALAVYRKHSANLGSEARDNLARLLEEKGDYLEAIQLLSEAVEIERRNEGSDSPPYTTTLHNLAGALARVGDLFTAEAKLRESLATERRVLGNAHPDLGYPLNLLGVVALEEGDWQSAEPLLRESLALWSRLGPTHPLVVTGLTNWGRLLTAKGEYAEARQYFARALALAQLQPRNGRNSAWVLYRFALLEFDSGNYSAAEGLARSALTMECAISGREKAPDTAWTMVILAEARVFQHDPKAAEPLLREALEILQRRLPSEYPPVTIARIRLGEALTAEGNAAAAEPLLRKALASTYAPPFTIPSWQIGEAESALGWCLSVLGHRQEAQRLLEQSQKKLLDDPRPIFRKQAAVHLKDLFRSRHSQSLRRRIQLQNVAVVNTGASSGNKRADSQVLIPRFLAAKLRLQHDRATHEFR